MLFLIGVDSSCLGNYNFITDLTDPSPSFDHQTATVTLPSLLAHFLGPLERDPARLGGPTGSFQASSGLWGLRPPSLSPGKDDRAVDSPSSVTQGPLLGWTTLPSLQISPVGIWQNCSARGRIR